MHPSINIPENNRQRNPSYNFMNDDIYDDIELQIISLDHDQSQGQDLNQNHECPTIIKPSVSIAESLQEKLYYLQTNHIDDIIQRKTQEYYDSISNSPLSLSGNNSVGGDSNLSNIHEYIGGFSGGSSLSEGGKSETTTRKTKTTYKKFTFEEIEHSFQKNYKTEKLMSEIDILITYIKGQKHIYTQSYRITKQKINILVFLSLLISGSLAVISPILQSIQWTGYLYSGLNALLTMITTFLNFWNLQNNLSQYNTVATHFDRIETSLIMTRNKQLLMSDYQEKQDYLLNKIRDTETRMLEMKDENQILVPLEIQLQVPIISHVDIFIIIQKIEQQTKILLLDYKDTKNEIRYIMYQWKTRDKFDIYVDGISTGAGAGAGEPRFSDRPNTNMIFDNIGYENESTKNNNSYLLSFTEMDPSVRKEQERIRLNILFHKKQSLKQEILDQYKKYTKIDHIFSKEIQNAENIYYFFSCSFFRRNSASDQNVQTFLSEL